MNPVAQKNQIDLQKGERFAQVDEALCSHLRDGNVQFQLVCSYDNACQLSRMGHAARACAPVSRAPALVASTSQDEEDIPELFPVEGSDDEQ
ncbi:hypothetical protein B0H15DRAFT_949437 [Mycena belliarum]|uniref:Uncharacterized protein n=1 Tax=Mycena belliarum TaxID=1033014 RepID=A0AAD6XM57_9AGAR|nr:hypothetical protein B0H15DRAFT_956829 [Mycena belliae]KAJ7075895.1 hypothetical protein B0H15DRAFT_956133 [Mycena belliae]KAJ7088806.1 hypothetical protein B0H15DRAFT_949437 [Mycena belliae]